MLLRKHIKINNLTKSHKSWKSNVYKLKCGYCNKIFIWRTFINCKIRHLKHFKCLFIKWWKLHQFSGLKIHNCDTYEHFTYRNSKFLTFCLYVNWILTISHYLICILHNNQIFLSCSSGPPRLGFARVQLRFKRTAWIWLGKLSGSADRAY